MIETNFKLASYNCKNYKANKNNVNKLAMENDVVFICEHWLVDSEQIIIKENLPNHNVYLHADEDVESRLGPGRPFGGFCWIVKKEFENFEIIKYNKAVSQLIITNNDQHLCIYA